MRSFGASSAHKGLWRAQEMFPDTLNHALTMWNVNGALDASVMESAFLHVMNEAEVLRVNFVDDGSGLRLVPRELGDWRPFFLDLGAEDDPERAAREALAEMVRQPFALDRDLLFRLGVVRLGAARSVLVIIYHHLISDGFGAAGLLSRRLAEVYTALSRGSDVPELPHPGTSSRSRPRPRSTTPPNSSPRTRSSGATTSRTRQAPRRSRAPRCPRRRGPRSSNRRATPTAGAS